MSIVYHEAGEDYPYELKMIVLTRLHQQGKWSLRLAMGQFFWPKAGWHDSETGNEVLTCHSK